MYLGRRAKRILPPYYAALAAFAAIILLVPGLNERSGTAWDSKVPVGASDVGAQALMVHNVHASAYKIDGPMWSVATEWQLYFLLPLLLIPLWRRIGPLAAAVVVIPIGLVAAQAGDRLLVAHAWYLGLFATGAAAAFVVAGRTHLAARVPWRTIALTTLALVLGAHLARRSFTEGHQWITEPVLGLAVAAAIIYMAGTPNSRLRRLLSSHAAVKLGLFSYSVYLVHSHTAGLGQPRDPRARRADLGPLRHYVRGRRPARRGGLLRLLPAGRAPLPQWPPAGR